MVVIGETGVGKTTWINAFANYLTFSTLEEATQAGGVFPTPSAFELLHPETGQLVRISSEGDSLTPISKAADVGKSDTRNPTEHRFLYENTQINVIDTPGLLDTEDESGHENDKEHVCDILRLLSAYDEIHAICIVMKASETRLSNSFKYTLTEILKRLDTDAVNNVLCIITCAATTRFKPSTTQLILESFLHEKHLNIPLPPNKETIYCFENDTVNYLVQCKNKIPQTKLDKETTQTNWMFSVTSTTKMLNHICSLNPHSLASIKGIYNAEQTIRTLSELMIETARCNLQNVNDLQCQKNAAEKKIEKIKKNPAKFADYDLRKLLYIHKRKPYHVELGHTNVVCQGGSCANVVNGELVCQQICCENCRSPWMLFCTSFDLLGYCNRCGCRRGQHVRRGTRTEILFESVYEPPESVIRQIVDKNSAVTEIKRTITECENQVETDKKATNHMLRTCAKLNTFLQQNVLMAHDTDDMTVSLHNKIQACERAGESSAALLADLRQIEWQYSAFLTEEQDMCILYREYDVNKLIQEMYNKLPEKGKDLKKAMMAEEQARKKVIENSKTSAKVMNLSHIRQATSKFWGLFQ